MQTIFIYLGQKALIEKISLEKNIYGVYDS